MRFFITLTKNFIKNDVLGTAAQTAFYLILSLPPLLVLVLAIGAKFNIEILDSQFLIYILPPNVYSIINHVVTSIKPSAQLTAISGIGVVFSASGSIWALMKGVHKAYSDSYMRLGFKYRIITAFFTIAFLVAFLISLGTLIMSGVWTGLLETLSGFEKGSFGVISRLLSSVLVYFFVYMLYNYTPDNNLKGMELFWGALFSAGTWTAVSIFFEIYVSLFTRYTTVYGGIGAFFILIMWLFIISMLVLTGAQINVTLAEISEKKSG